MSSTTTETTTTTLRGLFGSDIFSHGWYFPDCWNSLGFVWESLPPALAGSHRVLFPFNEFWGMVFLAMVFFVYRKVFVDYLKRDLPFLCQWHVLPVVLMVYQSVLYLISTMFQQGFSIHHEGIEWHPFWNSTCPAGHERPQWNKKVQEPWWLTGIISVSPVFAGLSLAVLSAHWVKLRANWKKLQIEEIDDIKARDRHVVVFMMPLWFCLASLATQVRLNQVLSGETDCDTQLEDYISLVKSMFQLAIVLQFFSTITIALLLYPCFPKGWYEPRDGFLGYLPGQKAMWCLACTVAVVGVIRCSSLMLMGYTTHIQVHTEVYPNFVDTIQDLAKKVFRTTNLANFVSALAFHWGIIIPVLKERCSDPRVEGSPDPRCISTPTLMFLGSRLIVLISTIQHQALVPAGFTAKEWSTNPLEQMLGACKDHDD